MTFKECKELEAILLEYVERFGLLPSARDYFGPEASGTQPKFVARPATKERRLQ